MNPTIDLLTNHYTCRSFTDEAVPPEAVAAMTAAARQASSWMNGQYYTVIRITDAALRRRIADAQPANPQIAQCGEYWIFVADAHRAVLCGKACGGGFASTASPELLLTVAVDAALAAQNAAVAAESLGYAVCYTGGIRQIAAQLAQWLALPEYTFPLFGLCIGRAAAAGRVKPRLPEAAAVAENRYPDAAVQAAALAEYEARLAAFGEAREKFPYREKFARFHQAEYAPQNRAFLAAQGFWPQD